MSNNDIFDGIPEDRDDEGCTHCSGGSLTGINGGHRKVGDSLWQSVWRCSSCDELVFMLDEDQDQMCPTCGTCSALTLSQLNNIKGDLYDE